MKILNALVLSLFCGLNAQAAEPSITFDCTRISAGEVKKCAKTYSVTTLQNLSAGEHDLSEDGLCDLSPYQVLFTLSSEGSNSIVRYKIVRAKKRKTVTVHERGSNLIQGLKMEDHFSVNTNGTGISCKIFSE